VVSKGAVTSNRFQSYSETPTGRQLIDAIDVPELIPEFLALSRIGKPAVQAVADEVATIIEALPTKSERDAASQFCGWFVGQIMRRLGYRVVQERGRVTGAPFKTGAVWEAGHREVQIVSALPTPCPRRVELKVQRGNDGAILGDWLAVQTAISPTRRVHTIVEGPKPVEIALHHAKEYAEKWGYDIVWIQDPGRLFPREQWNAAPPSRL
jgi:hypothetical protein